MIPIKHKIAGLCLLFFQSFTGVCQQVLAADTISQNYAVIELFTSEGCSSCPPMDDMVTRAVKHYHGNVYVLSFHVDYWDRAGWKDPFSNSGYTDRQNQYIKKWQLPSAYTPQVIVNGEAEFIDSGESGLQQLIDRQLVAKHLPLFKAVAKIGADGKIVVSYERAGKQEDILYMALLQTQTSSAVDRGENAGKLLEHINVVRDLQILRKSKGLKIVELPAGLQARDCRVFVFSQNPKTLRITGVQEISAE